MKIVHNHFTLFIQQKGLNLPLLLLYCMLLCTGTKAQPAQLIKDEAALLQTLRYHTSVISI
jgi:hypothetical protein